MTAWFDLQEAGRRAIKYLVLGFVVAIAAFAIPRRSLDLEEITMIALTAGATFALLDAWAPSIGMAMRTGAGFGLGANLVGFPGGL